MIENVVKEIDRKCLMVTLAIINNKLQFSKLSDSTRPIYNISSIDNSININIDFDSDDNTSFDNLKLLTEFCYQGGDYIINEINDDLDLLEYIYKYVNAIILEIDKESDILEEQKIHNCETDNEPTETQSRIFNKMIELEKLCASAYEIENNAYSAMIVAKFIAESVQQATLFINYLDLLDYMKVIFSFSQELPCHEEDIWLKFVTDMLKFKETEEINN